MRKVMRWLSMSMSSIFNATISPGEAPVP